MYIYLPIGLVVGMLIGVFIVLVWATFSPEGTTEIEQASGVADVFVTMLCLLPLSIVGLVLPAAGFFALYWRRQKGSLARKRVSSLFGKAERGINTADEKLNDVQPRIVDGTIKARSAAESTMDAIYNASTKAVNKIDSFLTKKDD